MERVIQPQFVEAVLLVGGRRLVPKSGTVVRFDTIIMGVPSATVIVDTDEGRVEAFRHMVVGFEGDIAGGAA
jgi:hypothetical protein